MNRTEMALGVGGKQDHSEYTDKTSSGSGKCCEDLEQSNGWERGRGDAAAPFRGSGGKGPSEKVTLCDET